MEVQRSITINLTEEEVKQIVAEHLNKEGYTVEAKDVQLEVGSHLEGYGTGEHSVNYFKGCFVNCKSK